MFPLIGEGDRRACLASRAEGNIRVPIELDEVPAGIDQRLPVEVRARPLTSLPVLSKALRGDLSKGGVTGICESKEPAGTAYPNLSELEFRSVAPAGHTGCREFSDICLKAALGDCAVGRIGIPSDASCVLSRLIVRIGPCVPPP